MEQAAEIKITRKKLNTLFTDTAQCAKAINLVYVTDKQPGISRKLVNGTFTYGMAGKPVKDKETLQRIKSLVLPPAWREVWICATDDGHLQATGIDSLNRKQYKYHPLWNQLRNQTKFQHLADFGKALPTIRQQLQKDISRQGFPVEKVLATVVSVMQCTCIRIGNNAYEQLYGSFGLTTLKDKHVTIKGTGIRFSFRGKKGVQHDITIKSRRLAKIVGQCRDIPGKELFQYYDDNGKRHPVDSGMVNNYIKAISGGNFTAKDFRTWAGTLQAIEAFRQIGPADTETAAKKNIVTALDMVAAKLGNTRTVCKKYYVHPMVIDHYTNKMLDRYITKAATADCSTQTSLSVEELVLLNMLEDKGSIVIAA